MTLPRNVEIKYSTYLLFCRQMLEHLPALTRAARTDNEEDVAEEKYLAAFDQRLVEFLKGRDYSESREAVENFARLLLTGVEILVDKKHAVYPVFQQLVSAALSRESSWDIRDELDRHHQQGRTFAQKFFGKCSPIGFAEKLEREVELSMEYGSSYTEGDNANVNLSLGYRVAPIATHKIRGPNGTRIQKIVLRVSYDNDFKLYLCYPFLFLHEYTSHIIGNDFQNAQFNDGWMLFAADEFLNSDWFEADEDTHPLNLNQVEVFRDHFYQKLGDICKKGYGTAFRLKSRLANNSTRMTFRSITCELAGFEPRAGERPFWPTGFINALRLELAENSRGFEGKIEACSCIRTLYSLLPHS